MLILSMKRAARLYLKICFGVSRPFIDSSSLIQTKSWKTLFAYLKCYLMTMNCYIPYCYSYYTRSGMEKEDDGSCQAKYIYFISPFITLLHSGDINFLQVWQDRHIRQISSSLIEKILLKLIQDLKMNTNLSQEQIDAICKDIQSDDKSTLEERKRSLRKICQTKEHFKRIELYYETLGQLSVLVHLWCLQEEDESISTGFFQDGFDDSYLCRYSNPKLIVY